MSLPVSVVQDLVKLMAEEWLGCLVSIDCGVTIGVYQGEVSAVDPNKQTISLRQPLHNGVRCLVSEVTFRCVAHLSTEYLFMDLHSSANSIEI